MEEHMRKLALWHTRTFTPIMTHEELETVMLSLGFEGKPPRNGWREYVYVATHVARELQDPQPRPRLPYPKLDGSHQYTFQAFTDAVNFYRRDYIVDDVLHIRGLPLHRVHDRSWKWRRMQEEETVYVYREGTIDQETYRKYGSDNPTDGRYGSAIIRDKANDSNNPTLTVALSNITQ